MPRTWGFWTKGKLQILERYLQAFCVASKAAGERVYLDLFAGQPENVERQTGEPIAGSAEIALRTGPPAFTRFRLFELGVNATKLEAELRRQFVDPDIEVYAGDCNERITDALTRLRELRWAPTFAFIDPNGPDCHWSTLVQLADHKRGQRTKVELWILLPVALFTRNLPVDGATPVREEDAEKITLMYGTDEWRHIYDARRRGDFAPVEAREEYVNLMRWRLEQNLGYAWTHPFEVFNEGGVPLYHMIFATDHEAGTRIMSHLYGQAALEFPVMQAEARQRRKDEQEQRAGILSLFPAAEMMALQARIPGQARVMYQHQPPEKPFWITGA